MLQCVAMCCGALQCVAVCCSVLQCVAVCCSVGKLDFIRVPCCSVVSATVHVYLVYVPQCIAMYHSVLQCVAVCCSVLQCVAVSYQLLCMCIL